MRNGGSWTEARYRAFVVGALRSATRRYPPRNAALKNAFIEQKISKKSNRLAKHYACAICRKLFTSTDIQIDHIDPVVDPKVGFVSWDVYISRMYCEADNFQVLCKPCHKIKTKEERQQKCSVKTT
jgi:5-methylcytosine-specific restriction endonuclease McrA